MTDKTTFVVALFTVSVLLLGTMATPLNMLPSAEALKGQGVSSSKYGSATKGTVCGDKLCSEVRAEEAKKQEKERDRRTFDFMQWFVKEQIEEEDTIDRILQKFDVIGRDKLAINEIDKYMKSSGGQDSKKTEE